MKTKKILTIILFLSMLLIFAVPVSASSTTSSIRVTSVGETVVGSIVSVPIVLEENSGFVSLSVKILFDSSALTLETVTDTGKLIGGCFEGYYDSPYYLVWENDIATKNNTYTGEIATLQFRVNEDAKPGTYSVEIIMDDYGAIDKDGNSVKFSLYSGTITITESKHQCSFGDWEEYSAKKHIRYCYGCDEYELEAHSFVSWKNYDDEQHKRSCSCGEVEYEDHNWDNGVTSANIITYTCEDCEATKTKTIAPDTVPVTGITLSNSELTITVGETVFIDAIITPSNATNQIISWASNNTSVASIGWMVENKTHGVISAKAVGTATITATTEDGSFVAQCVVTVVAPEPDNIPVTGITLSESAVTLKVGVRQWIEATVLPYDAANKLVNWTCSDLTIADIAWSGDNNSRGLIVSRSAGTAVITASTADGSFVAQCTVTVIDDNTPVDPNAPVISIDNVTSSAGKTVEVNIALKNNPGIASMKLKVSYDEAVLSLQNIRYNSSIGGQSQQPQTMASPVTLNWYNGGANSEGDFVYATLVFLVKDTASAGTSSITVTYDPEDVYNLDYTNIDFAVQNGQITIVDHIPGDISGDGSVNNKDLSLLFQYLSDWDVKVNEAALDVSGDGKVNNKDLSLLFQYLSDWDVEIH